MEKVFLCIWTNTDKTAMNSYDSDKREERVSFFTEEKGYTEEDIKKINQIELGQTYNCESCY